ncbi:MAG: hypothetical protein K0B11_21125 [Mariniphaga sp.]|nr:hypothetical protein [Mariniphaga sp.]
MKNYLLTLAFIGILIITACNTKTDVTNALDNSESRKEIYSTILNDHQMMNEFMEMMNENKHDMMMQVNHKEINDMISVFMNDIVACDQLTDSMMTHQGMMHMMLDKMHSKEMIDKNTKEQTEKRLDQQYDFSKVRHWH